MTTLPFPEKSPCTAIATDSDERLFIGHANGIVAIFAPDLSLIRRVCIADTKPVICLSCYPGGFLAATKTVIQLFEGHSYSCIDATIRVVTAVASRFAFVSESEPKCIQVRPTPSSGAQALTLKGPVEFSQIAISDTHVAALTLANISIWMGEQPSHTITLNGQLPGLIALSSHSLWLISSSHKLTQYPLEKDHKPLEYDDTRKVHLWGSNGTTVFFHIFENTPDGYIAIQSATDTPHETSWSYHFSMPFSSDSPPNCPSLSFAGNRIAALSTGIAIYEREQEDEGVILF